MWRVEAQGMMVRSTRGAVIHHCWRRRAVMVMMVIGEDEVLEMVREKLEG